MPCYFPCVNCLGTATNCTSCSIAGQIYFYNSTANQCKLCYHIIPNCATCDYNGTVCYSCNSTLVYLGVTPNVCQNCTTPCLKCTAQYACISCVDDTYAIDPSNLMCRLCSLLMPNCATCLTSTVCLTCNNPTTYYLTYPPSKFGIM